MNNIEFLLNGIGIPSFVKVCQKFSAVGVGSRGIANLPVIVRTVVELLQERGAHTFIVPAMGSHSGATAQGQEEVLAHLGVTEDSVGAPIRATMDVVQVGTSSGGIPLWGDKYAADSDGIVVINRIKPHTSFHGPVESGLLKMLVIGLGKQRGADSAHVRGFAPMSEHILDMSKALIKRLPICFGVAVVESCFSLTLQRC